MWEVIAESGILLGIIGLLLRELQKSRSFKKQNGSLDIIHKKVIAIDGKTDEIPLLSEKISNMREHCTTVSGNMEKGITQNQKNIKTNSDNILQIVKNSK